MLLKPRKISHIRQTKSNNCVAACLAMVTGKDIEQVEFDLKMDGFEAPYTNEAYIRFLVQNNIFPERIGYTLQGPLLDNTVYLMTCSSPCSAASAHMIVGAMYKGVMMIKDPSDSLEREKIYSDKGFLEGSIPIFEYLALADCSPDE